MRPMPASATPDAVPAVAREQKKWTPVARDEPLLLRLHHRDDREPPLQTDGAGSFPWLATAGFAYLTFSSGMALHRSRGDPGAAAFVAFAYADLLLLLCCVRAYERAEPGSSLRDWLKLAVWLLTAALTLVFSYKVAALMPPAAAALVWAMGLATIAGGFAAFFCFRTPQEMAVGKTLHTQAQSSPAPSSPVSAITLDVKQISGAARWSPSLPRSLEFQRSRSDRAF